MATDPLPVAPRLGTRRKGAKPQRQPLNADAIADAALQIIDAEGVDAVSMRRVAEKLGTGAASLYAHVDNKDALFDLVLDRVVGEMEVPEPDPERWQEQLKECMRNQRDALMAHKDVAKIALARIPTGPNALPVIEKTLAVLVAAGLPDRVVGLAPDLMGLYVNAVTLEQTQYGPEWTPGEISEFTDELRAFFESLPEDRFPLLKALAGPLTHMPELGQPDVDERFEFGLEVIVRGLEAVAREG